MKITREQRRAAALYWTQILTGQINSYALNASKRDLPPFMASLAASLRKESILKLEESKPNWSLKFRDSLDSLLVDAEDKLCLKLEYHLEGLLKQAATRAGLPEAVFPAGRLSMTFDNNGNIIVGGETINAEHFIYETQQMTASLA